MVKQKISIGSKSYIVLNAKTFTELEKHVNIAIDQYGYIPIGGIIIWPGVNGFLFIQAILKILSNGTGGWAARISSKFVSERPQSARYTLLN